MSQNPFDWLGRGFYFFQDSPWRAFEWARTHHGKDAAVIASTISLEACADLLDPCWQELLRDADGSFVASLLEQGQDPPVNRGGNRARDCATINWFCERQEREGPAIKSVRAIFLEGEPLFDGSLIYNQSHLQIAVRDPSVIVETEALEL